MCTFLHTGCTLILDKILKYCKNLQKVCRVVALIDAVSLHIHIQPVYVIFIIK